MKDNIIRTCENCPWSYSTPHSENHDALLCKRQPKIGMIGKGDYCDYWAKLDLTKFLFSYDSLY